MVVSMANGTIGDDPYTDIVLHGQDVYSAAADSLVREIATLADDRTQRELAARLIGEFNDRGTYDLEQLERVLTEIRDRLRHEARARGFEV